MLSHFHGSRKCYVSDQGTEAFKCPATTVTYNTNKTRYAQKCNKWHPHVNGGNSNYLIELKTYSEEQNRA